MKKIVILIGSFCYNRGSEALVRGTIDIVKRYIPDSQIVLCSGEESFGAQLNVSGVDKYVRRQSYYGGFSCKRLAANILNKAFHNKVAADRIKYGSLLKECSDADLVIVSGGDNYDKSYHMYDLMHSVNAAIRHTSGAKMVMYDLSLAESEITDDVVKDFSLFDAVTARENDTYAALKKHLSNVPVYYYPDPAFVMQPKETKLPSCFENSKVIGINLSTMAVEAQYGSDKNTVLQAYVQMVDWILENTGHNVLLIPHVMRGLDLKVLRELYAEFSDNSRVYLLDNEELNAMELKHIISQCDVYVGARTHSTIAAYSSRVPTLVLGYSVKSIGIARDIFGKYEGYVVPVSTISEASKGALKDAFEAVCHHKAEMREYLTEHMEDYISKAWQAGTLFAGLVEETK